MIKYEELPPEMRTVKFLEPTLNSSVRLRNTFAGASLAGWGADIGIVVNSSSKELHTAHVAAFLAASTSTALALIGTLAIVRLRHFLHCARTEQNKFTP